MSHQWTQEQLKKLGKVTDDKLAADLGISVSEVVAKRKALRIRPNTGNWGATELGMLGRYSDAEIARVTGRSPGEVKRKREELGREQS